MTITDMLFHSGIFILFLLAGLLIFLFGSSYFNLFRTNRSNLFRATLAVGFLILALVLFSRDSLAVYGQVAYAFFTAACANLFGTLAMPWIMRQFKLSDNSMKGLALAKFSEAMVVVVTILGLFLLAGIDLGSIFFQVGNLTLGLAIGLISFSLFAAAAFFQIKTFQLGSNTLLSLLPWILTFALSNAFMEELWFRGIFLKKFDPLLGAVASLILTSIVFTGAHFGATYLSWPERIRFLVLLFPLSLAWGFTMQLTDSLIGSTLFHAGGDLLIINGFIAALHGKKFQNPLSVEEKTG